MNPYQNLANKFFWKLAVAEKHMFDINDLWNPKFEILPEHKVSTYGSCFAQHIGNALNNKTGAWFVTEKPPNGLNLKNIKKFNYNIFTSRTGNIYTTSLLKQWAEWAVGSKNSPKEYWEQNDRFYDPFRPLIEPGGFVSINEMLESRKQTINYFRESIERSDFFVFTLGLTESWYNCIEGYEYPMCPGTVSGKYNKNLHKFKNQQFHMIINNLKDAFEIMMSINPKLKFILTVSPVPLTATKSKDHVLMATIGSKSILRAVAGQLASNLNYVDYFPSYEIINSPPFKGVFFEKNQRSVSKHGVNFVMDSFFKALVSKFGIRVLKNNTNKNTKQDEISFESKCEEELLEAFGGKNR